MTERSSTSTPDDDRVGAIREQNAEDAIAYLLSLVDVEWEDLLAAVLVDLVTRIRKQFFEGTPQAFLLARDEDVSGVSGEGLVAEGIRFSDGTVALRWLSDWPTSVVFHDRGIESVEAVHGHDGRTRIVWLYNDLAAAALRLTDDPKEQAVIEAAQEWAEHRPNLALEANLAAALAALSEEEPSE